MGVGAIASLVGPCAWAQQSNTGSIYTCVDRQGRRLTADRPIAECLDREQRELGPTGTVRRQIGPSLTEQERAALEVQRRKEAEERTRQQEERRRERVLTARYPDKAAHDVERAAAIQLLDDVTAIAEKRMAELQQQRKALDTEMEFYQRDPAKAPMALRRKIADELLAAALDVYADKTSPDDHRTAGNRTADALAEIAQETDSFSPLVAELPDFEAYGLYFGNEILQRVRGVGPLGGFLDVAAQQTEPVVMLPIVRAWGSAGGSIAAGTLGYLTERLLTGLKQALPVDAVFLSLHGAAAAQNEDDVEGYVLQAIRGVIGADLGLTQAGLNRVRDG